MNHKPVRGRPRSEKTHKAILVAAYQLLKREGYGGAAIERIAAEAGVAKQTIYRWWPNKASLFLEVLFERSAGVVSLPDTGSLRGDLEALLHTTFVTVSEALKPLMCALAAELIQDSRLAGQMREVFVKRNRTHLHMLIERAKSRKEISPRAKANFVCDMIFGSMWYRLIFEHAPLDKRMVHELVTASLLYCRY